MTPDPDQKFDAVAAVAELEEAMREDPSSAPSTEQQDYVSVLESEIEELHTLLAQKDELVERAGQRADQAHAEVEAVSRRAVAEATRELERRTRQLLEGFLEVVDDLDRAIAATRTVEHRPEVLAGIELVRRKMLAHVGQYGVAHAPALGERFDPARHEGMALVPTTDPAQEGRVVHVIREGYSIGKETLRPAGVAVGRA